MSHTTKYFRRYGRTKKELMGLLGVCSKTLKKYNDDGSISPMAIDGSESSWMPRDKRHASNLRGINSRCTNPSDKDYRFYGAKGIRNFLSYDDIVYLWKRDMADMLTDPTIDRIDPYGPYSIMNCRYIERAENVSRSSIGRSKESYDTSRFLKPHTAVCVHCKKEYARLSVRAKYCSGRCSSYVAYLKRSRQDLTSKVKASII
jgi:hypothetical protein